MRSGLRKRSNSRPNRSGSRSVMVSAQATSEPAPEPRPGPTGMPLRLRPLDEVGNDQEVAGKLHAGDDVELVGEPLLVVLAREAIRKRRDLEALRQSVLGLPLQLRGLGVEAVLVAGAGTRRWTKLGRIGFLPRTAGRRSAVAISTVLASASGRSANSSAISSARLEIVLAASGGADRPRRCSCLRRCRSARRAPRSRRDWRNRPRWSRRAAGSRS